MSSAASSSAASSSAAANTINAETARYCFIDLDIWQHRSKLAAAAAFVHATDSRYGFSSKDLLSLGGSELARVRDILMQHKTDHEWSLLSLSKKIGGGGGGDSAIEIRPPVSGNRIVVRLNWEVAPLACENFATLCDNGSSSSSSLSSGASSGCAGKKKPTKPVPIGESGKPLTYRNSTVHRIIPNFILQGGDFVFGNGSGGESIYNGKKFKDERAGLLEKHDRRGVLSMGNSGKNSNSSQWFITLGPAPQCDGKHVVFGSVVSGWDVLDAAETMGRTAVATSSSSSSSSSDDGPVVPAGSVTVTECGLWTPRFTPGAGYWFDQPDADSFTGVSPVFVVRPRVAIVAPSDAVREKFCKALLPHCSVVHRRELIVVAAGGDNNNDGEEEAAAAAAAALVIHELLQGFAVDVVLVAPTCMMSAIGAAIQQLHASSWSDRTNSSSIALADVVMEARPVEALEKVRTKSWLSQKSAWKLDGQQQQQHDRQCIKSNH